ncbi:putative Beta-ketoacyl synthase domain-containing protein [Seiridium cardinale]|uniref:Beta-ketoacyl synthase domain-containing protein n=1 Tax=Seiridium cardinale TaxID=138064 RepID=A0ABR2XM20_9PEZI
MHTNEPIAVVGSACRLPGGIDTPSKLWDLLSNPKDLQSEVPPDRFNIDAFYHPDGNHHGRTNARHGYFLNGPPYTFDAPFFNIQAGEAESIDPQQRLLLETTYDALSGAGYGLHDLRGSDTAVYVGLMTHDFELVNVKDVNYNPTYFATGAATSIASNRLSYFFDWRGPSFFARCSPSRRSAAEERAERNGHCSRYQLDFISKYEALGSSATKKELTKFDIVNYITESKLKMLSPTGRSRMWDAAADGYARGEGICAVVMKTLRQALQDGDDIECIIRETGVNQDGRTTGITMPSHIAQEELIRSTYSRAGLNIENADDRCQFFEAHGTGTPAGDPQEAQAIAGAFYGSSDTSVIQKDNVNLFVGSLKTVIGHTEGTAGIAGLLKASLAVQHGFIPPNMLFENISPTVAPFYDNLVIPTEAQVWPELKPGFGGTNAHAIIEQYVAPVGTSKTGLNTDERQDQASYLLPLVLSAKTERSLKTMADHALQWIESNPEVEMLDLAWTLLRKRSIFQYRKTVTAYTRESLCLALKGIISENDDSRNNARALIHQKELNILGIFTGQGAQWPGMLKELISAVPFARDIIAELDHSLQTLPAKYRPDWVLSDQFVLEGASSNITKATYSQPLCCAVQIVLIRLLAAAGITFTTIVGHSSGEIACAFAAGFISASQAIRVAYLRGLVSRAAQSSSGGDGAMLAAGTSLEDAQELCSLEMFEGRVCIAASNSPDSTTLSGDADAIAEMHATLEDESKFARVLNVDKAYHSHHMIPCSSIYLEALADCGCDKADGDGSLVAWWSSVHENKRMKASDVSAKYWTDNLVSPVLFMQAVEVATIESGRLDTAIEVGCHPALEAPCLATLKTIIPDGLPYTGCMRRGSNDIESFATALGYIWERFPDAFNPESFITKVISPQRRPQNLSKKLPRYPWDHSRTYWKGTRAINHHLYGQRPHLLLGSPSVSNTSSTFQWQNTIRPRDHSWLQGHALQGQTVFPAAGYVIMAMEAGLQAAGQRPVQLLEVVDMSINKAITFDDENSPAELILTAQILHDVSNDHEKLTFGFTIDSCLSKESKPSTSAKGQLVVSFGDVSSVRNVLPSAEEDPPHLTNVNMKNFYMELDELGFDYSKEYRCIYSMGRVDAQSAGTMAFPPLDDETRSIVMHPASLDLAFQTIMGAYSAPADKRLRSIYVPIHVDRISLNPTLCESERGSKEQIARFRTTNTYDRGDILAGDVDILQAGGSDQVVCRVENLVLKPLSPPSASEDHKVFTKTVWGPLKPDTLLDNPDWWATEQDKQVIPIIERVCYFYMKQFISQLTEEDRVNATAPHQRYIYWNEHVSAKVRDGIWHEWYSSSWEADTIGDIEKLCADNWYHPHIKMVKRVSENALATIREKSNPFLWMDNDGLLEEFYKSYLTSGPGWLYGADLVNQICHRHQNMDILEIGGGTGSATKYVLNIPQLGFNSYTFTDISPAFFESAEKHFADHRDRMIYQKLDITRSPGEQGFNLHSYDMIIASSVLHATPKLVETMTNVRSLLKPGGHLVLLEATHRDHTRVGYLFGLFPDWWAGLDEGRDLDPFADINQWDEIFKKTGFSGVDTRTLDRHGNLFPNTLFSTRAINSKVARLDSPVPAMPPQEDAAPLVIIGGQSAASVRIAEELRQILANRRITRLGCLEDVLQCPCVPKSTFLVLSELDQETFSGLNNARLEAVKFILGTAANVLWLTENAWISNPYQAMTAAMLRSARLEYPALHTQSLDIDNVKTLDVKFLVDQLLRLEEVFETKENILWTMEPEVYISKSRAYIPRVKHDKDRNDRINSKRRAISTTKDPHNVPLTLQVSNGQRYLESESHSPPDSSTSEPCHLRVVVEYSLANAIRVGDMGYLHLVQGTVVGTGKTVIGFAYKNASIVDVHVTHVTDMPLVAAASEGPVLLPIAASLIAQNIIRYVCPGAAILVLDPPLFCLDAIANLAKAQNVRVYLAAADVSPTIKSSTPSLSWIQLHPNETDARLRKLIPGSISAVYDMSTKYSDMANLSPRIVRCLTSGCPIFGIGHVVQSSATPTSYTAPQDPAQMTVIKEEITRAISRQQGTTAKDIRVDDMSALKPLSGITGAVVHFPISTTIDWRTAGGIAARVRAIDSERMFVPDKTYLLLGLAGSLGRSLARWLVTHGACHVILSSRNPEAPDKRWVKEIESLGGKIEVLSIDVSKKTSIDAALEYIRGRLPPVGGIAYGPLVLHDALLASMDIAMMQVPINSKVVGAQILHERFSDQASQPLDFFVMFSSVATVGGNPGQANYTAANAYLQALAQHRRSKGLPASTIHIGAVIGVGYLARTQREEEFRLASDTDTISEDEFLTLFAEAVVSGRPTENSNMRDITDTGGAEIITGIPEFSARQKDTIKFYEDPRFGNIKIPESRTSTDAESSVKSSIKDQLLRARTLDDVQNVIINGLSAKMRGILHVPADEQIDVSSPLIDQGVDSLGAITVGSWFSKTLMIDVPLLRVVSGASIVQLAEEASGRLSAAAIPLVVSTNDSTDTAPPSSNEGSGDISSPTNSLTDTSVSDVESNSDVKSGQTTIHCQVPLSLTQEYSWKLLQTVVDPSIFYNTIGVFMKGAVNHGLLRRALDKSLHRHEIFRTAFPLEQNHDAQPLQTIMEKSAVRIRFVAVADRAAAEEAYRELLNQEYNLRTGETLKIVDYYWGQDEHLFVFGYHRLVGDGSTTQNFLAEVDQLYHGAKLPTPPQYRDFCVRQRAEVDGGQLDASISHWTSTYKSLPAILPILPLPQAQKQRSTSRNWKQHVSKVRLSAVLAFRIRERCKKFKGVTPMHFYLAVFHLLLSRLAGHADIPIGIADTNRSRVQDVSTMGFFADLVPVRMAPYEPAQTFSDKLLAVKESLRQSMPHGCIPSGVVLDRLGLGLASAKPSQERDHAPLFQAVFDYRQGAAETGQLGGAHFTEIWASRERTPHDVVLEMSDDPARDPLVTLNLQSHLYGEGDTKAFLNAYVGLLTNFSTGMALRVSEGALSFS